MDQTKMEHNRLLTRGWVLSLLAAGFVAIHLALFHVLRRTNLAHRFLPGALISVVILVAVAKHVGLLAILLRRLHSVFRKQPRP
jgi:hypothetical protein